MSITKIGKYLCERVKIPSKNACFLSLDEKHFLKRFTNPTSFIRETTFIDTCKNIEEIIKYEDIIEDKNCKYVVYPNLNCNDLFFHIMNSKMNKETRNKIFYNIMIGVDKIHKKNLIHGDFKIENIMVQNDTSVKIIDFEFSQLLSNDNIPNKFGSRSYLSPEKMDGNIISKKSDIWALGILYYKLINYEEPYERKFINSQNYYPNQESIIDEFIMFSKDERHLFNMMVQNDYNKRKNPDEIIKFLKNYLI